MLRELFCHLFWRFEPKWKKILRLNHLLQEGRRRRVKLSLKMLIVWWDHTCHHAHLGLTGILLFSLFLYVLSAKTSESNLSDKQEGSNYVFQFIFCSFTIMDIPYMLKYLGIWSHWHSDEQLTVSHLICTLISENEGLENLRSASNLRKISVPAHLNFF